MSIWRKYNGALIPTTPPHIEVNTDNITQKLKDEKAFFARWTSDFDQEEKSEFWYVICDKKMSLSGYSRNTRSKINRGNKKLYVKKISKTFIIENAYNVYKKAFKRYEAISSPKRKEVFKNSLKNLEGTWDFWAVFLKENNQIVGYSQNKIIDNYCDYSTIKFDPDFLKFYSSYVLYFQMNQYYLNQNSFKYVNIGARSLLHKTNTQQYLIEKFNFRKAYCNLHLEYRSSLKIIVKILYRCKYLFKFLKWNFLFNKIYGLLLHEEIKRTFSLRLLKNIKPVIVIGAARSGTHLIASTIRENIDCIYLNEINDLWKKRFPFLTLDEIEKDKITQSKLIKIRKDFSNLLKNKEFHPFLLEKTASNCLRLDLVQKVFPNAKFIHILRDGRDVAVSTRKKYFGDIRKISSQDTSTISSKNRFINFFEEISHKIRNGLTPLMFISNSIRYLRMSLVILGFKKRDFWGPRFKGYRKLYKSISLIELASEQWRYSVLSILEFIKKNPENTILTIKYEDLVKDPDKQILKIINFILENNISTHKSVNHNIQTRGFKNWKDVLTTKEVRIVEKRIYSLLKDLKYE
ncbi:MAG: hypothetical protein CMD02_07620 [Flavobacteriales bacterium]|nr:hypothetical protein [Flavobacteriales bacterium]